jgi:flagellin
VGKNNGVATGAQFFSTITSIKSNKIPAGAIETGVGATVAGPGPVTMVGSDIASGSAVAAASLLSLKTVVDNMNIAAGTLYNKVSNTMSHMGSLNAGYQLDLASKMDVDFAGETAELAKGQILAQAGTAMLAQANAQRQGMLALLQS